MSILIALLREILQELRKLNESLPVLRKEQNKTVTAQRLKAEEKAFKEKSLEETRRKSGKLRDV